MYVALKRGDVSKTLEEAAQFFDWMQKNYASCLDDVRLKVLELVMYAERIAFHEGGMSSTGRMLPTPARNCNSIREISFCTKNR